MTKAWRGSMAVSLSGLGLWFAFRGIDWPAFKASLTSVLYPGLLAVVPIVLAVEYAARSLRWKTLLSPMRDAPLSVHYPITAAGFFLNNVLPFRAGEVARTYWTAKQTKAPFSAVLATLAMDRLFDMLTLLTLLLLLMWHRAELFVSPVVPALFAAATFVGLALLFVCARFPERVRVCLTRLPVVPARWADQFVEGAAILRRTRHIVFLFVLSLSFWAMNITLQMAMARLFGLHLSWLEAGWIMLAFALGAMIPSAPGYIGTIEAAGASAFVLLGHDKTIALSFILVMHAVAIASSALFGLPSLWIAGLHLAEARRPIDPPLEETRLISIPSTADEP